MSCPRRPLPLMMQYGTSFLRHSAGSQHTISIGSTSWAMTTSLAVLFSTRVVTWLRPYFKTTGFLPLLPSFPAFFCSANSIKRAFLASRVSGMYFLHSFKTCAAWFLSMAQLNWLMAGGTFNRMSIIFLALCRRTYFGHLMNLLRSRFGWMSAPRRKFLGVFSKRGFFWVFFFVPPRGAAGTFLPPDFAFPFGAMASDNNEAIYAMVAYL